MANGIVGQVDAAKVPRYAGLTSFARLPQLDSVERFDVAVVGIPFDTGVSYRPGARFGPSAIRQASRLLRPYNPPLKASPFDTQQVVDAGDIAVSPFDIQSALIAIEDGLEGLLALHARLVLLGGDHTISLPILRALHRRHGPICLVHFDAHLDTWDTYFGEAYTHGTPFRRASEEGLLDPSGAFHIGTRNSVYASQDLIDDARMGFQIITAEDVGSTGPAGVSDRLTTALADRPVHLSIDIDVLDPAHAPGTGTPEPGGLSSRELLSIIRGLTGLNIIAADVVEVAPAYDHAEITSLAAASVVYEILSLLARRTVTA